MKKSLLFACLFLVLVLGVSVLISGFSFGDFFNPTGNVAWEITDATGICVPSYDVDYDYEPPTMVDDFSVRPGIGAQSENYKMFNANNIDVNSPEYNSWCFFTSKESCEAKIGCLWDENYIDFNVKMNVHEGYNMFWGLYNPGQISFSDDMSPENIKAIYLLDPTTKENLEVYPDSRPLNSFFGTLPTKGFLLKNTMETFPSFVYFDKSGSINYRLRNIEFNIDGTSFSGSQEGEFSLIDSKKIGSQSVLIKGWNYLGIIPAFYWDVNGVNKDGFTLNNVKGNCDIKRAYYFENTTQGELDWVSIGPNENIPKSKMLRSIAVEVEGDCTLARLNPGTGVSCVETDSTGTGTAGNSKVKGTVKLYQGGQVIEERTDVCLNDYKPEDDNNLQGVIRYIAGNQVLWSEQFESWKPRVPELIEYYCWFEDNGDANIMINLQSFGYLESGQCDCVDGACV